MVETSSTTEEPSSSSHSIRTLSEWLQPVIPQDMVGPSIVTARPMTTEEIDEMLEQLGPLSSVAQ